MQHQNKSRTLQKLGVQDLIDQGLRSYLLKVYNYMSLGLALTGVVAFFVGNNPALLQALYPIQFLIILAPLGFVLALSFGIHRMSVGTAQLVFWSYAAVMGLSLSWIFVAYTGLSVAKTFFITAGTFAGMSLYGYTTKRDLTQIGTFFLQGLLGLFLVMLVQLFLRSSALDFVVSVAGVVIFVGLTAYDTQALKGLYFENEDTDTAEKKAIMGALTLYLDFINLFLFLLRFIGNRR